MDKVVQLGMPPSFKCATEKTNGNYPNHFNISNDNISLIF